MSSPVTVLPKAFDYLRSCAITYGHSFEKREYEMFARRLPTNRLRQLEEVAQTIADKNDARGIAEWLDSAKDDHYVGYTGPVYRLLALLDWCGNQFIDPFWRHGPYLAAVEETVDWSVLPATLTFLAGPSSKYGRYQSDDALAEFIGNARRSDVDALRDVAAELRNRRLYSALLTWIDAHDIAHPKVCAILYGLIGVLDAMRFAFEAPTATADHPVETPVAGDGDTCECRRDTQSDDTLDLDSLSDPIETEAEDDNLLDLDGLPDPIEAFDDLAALVANGTAAMRRRVNACRLLCNVATESASDGERVAGALSTALMLSDDATLVSRLWERLLRLVRAWDLSGQARWAEREWSILGDIVEVDAIRREVSWFAERIGK